MLQLRRLGVFELHRKTRKAWMKFLRDHDVALPGNTEQVLSKLYIEVPFSQQHLVVVTPRELQIETDERYNAVMRATESYKLMRCLGVCIFKLAQYAAQNPEFVTDNDLSVLIATTPVPFDNKFYSFKLERKNTLLALVAFDVTSEVVFRSQRIVCAE